MKMVKRNKNNWVQNIENIFTKKELDELVNSNHLEKVEVNNKMYYIKIGCRQFFSPTDNK